MVEDCEGSLSNWKAGGVNYQSVNTATKKNDVKKGKQSLKVAYDFNGTTGTSVVYAHTRHTDCLPRTLIRIGMWVYGKGHCFRFQPVDVNNQVV